MRPRRVVLVVVAAVVFAASVWSVVNYQISHRAFDRAVWLSADVTQRVRVRMVDDLTRRHHLVGKTEAEVVALLGPPTDELTDWDRAWYLGPDRGYDSPEWFAVRMDDAGRVARYRVVGG